MHQTIEYKSYSPNLIPLRDTATYVHTIIEKRIDMAEDLHEECWKPKPEKIINFGDMAEQSQLHQIVELGEVEIDNTKINKKMLYSYKAHKDLPKVLIYKIMRYSATTGTTVKSYAHVRIQR